MTTINVTQKHIKDARKGILYRAEEPTCCPIALALFEEITGRKYRFRQRIEWEPKRKFKVEFENQSHWSGNPFSVAKDIRVDGMINEKRYIQHYIKMPQKMQQFIIDFDKARNVEPFTFKIDLQKATIEL